MFFWQLFILEPLLELDKQKDFSSQYVFPSKNLDFVLNTSINSYSFKAFHNLVFFIGPESNLCLTLSI